MFGDVVEDAEDENKGIKEMQRQVVLGSNPPAFLTMILGRSWVIVA